MKSSESGLTVGELTIAVTVAIIAGLIWTTVSDKKDSEANLSGSDYPCLTKEMNI